MYNPPGSSIHGISQARIPEWIAISFSRGSSGPRNRTQVSRCGQTLYRLHNNIYLYFFIKNVHIYEGDVDFSFLLELQNCEELIYV